VSVARLLPLVRLQTHRAYRATTAFNQRQKRPTQPPRSFLVSLGARQPARELGKGTGCTEWLSDMSRHGVCLGPRVLRCCSAVTSCPGWLCPAQRHDFPAAPSMPCALWPAGIKVRAWIAVARRYCRRYACFRLCAPNGSCLASTRIRLLSPYKSLVASGLPAALQVTFYSPASVAAASCWAIAGHAVSCPVAWFLTCLSAPLLSGFLFATAAGDAAQLTRGSSRLANDSAQNFFWHAP